MKGTKLKNIMKVTSMLLIFAVFIVVACSEINPQNADPAPEPTDENPVVIDGKPIDEAGDAEGAQNEENELSQEERLAKILDLNTSEGKLSVRYFYTEDDERTGDTILVVTPDGYTMTIDAGTKVAGPQFDKYLDEMGIDKIDVLVNTHPHSDHLGGYPEVMRDREVDRVYMINHPYPSSGAYNSFMNAVKSKKIDPVFLEEGDSFEVGEHVKVEVYRPIEGELPDAIVSYAAKDINQFSMVFKVIYGDTSFLFNGDIYTIKEEEILQNLPHELIDADMMHAPHHGSETSSSSGYVDAVSPKVVAMSSNIFTSLKLLQRYEYYGATPLSTALHGNILITSDGKDVDWMTEKDWVNPLAK